MANPNQSETFVFPSELEERIPNVTIAKELADLQIQCAICFDAFSLNEAEVRKLPCNHLFHGECIFRWLQNKASCPVCRFELPISNQHYIDSLDLLQSLLLALRATIISTRAGLNSIRQVHEIIEQIDDVQLYIQSAVANVHPTQTEQPEERISSASGQTNQTTTSTVIASGDHSQVSNVAPTNRSPPQLVFTSARTSRIPVSTRRRGAARNARNAVAGIYRRPQNRDHNRQ